MLLCGVISFTASRTGSNDFDAASFSHPIDHPDFISEFDRSSVFVIETTRDEQEDVDVVVKGILRDLEGGLRPEDIAVVCLDGTGILRRVHDQLQTLGIRTLPLTDGNRDGFRQEGHVTLSSVRRAKGNEAYKVYATNLHLADASEVRDLDQELVARNQVFVALTRTKLWCVAIGRDVPLMQELKAAADQRGTLAFRAFNQASLRRAVGDTEGRQMDLI